MGERSLRPWATLVVLLGGLGSFGGCATGRDTAYSPKPNGVNDCEEGGCNDEMNGPGEVPSEAIESPRSGAAGAPDMTGNGDEASYVVGDAAVLVRIAKAVYQFGDSVKPNYKTDNEYKVDVERMKADASALGYKMVAWDLVDQDKLSITGPAFGAILENASRFVLVYRGSVSNSMNWMNDLDVAQAPWLSGGKVHRGFQRVEGKLWTFAKAFFDRPDNRTKPVWLTGHSLGAAMATLAASRLKREFPDIIIEKIYVFAQPRVGDLDFVKAYERDGLDRGFIKFSTFNDLVSVFPTGGMGFRNGGKLVLFDSENAANIVNFSGHPEQEESALDVKIVKSFLAGLIEQQKLSDEQKTVLREMLGALSQTDASAKDALKEQLGKIIKLVIQENYDYIQESHRVGSYVGVVGNRSSE